MKEFIFIISWCLAITVSDPCPNANNTDEFGRKSNYSCLAYHYHIEQDCDYEKTFTSKDSAMVFYNRVKEQMCVIGSDWNFNSKISSIKLDSTEINRILINDTMIRFHIDPTCKLNIGIGDGKQPPLHISGNVIFIDTLKTIKEY